MPICLYYLALYVDHNRVFQRKRWFDTYQDALERIIEFNNNSCGQIQYIPVKITNENMCLGDEIETSICLGELT